MGFRPIRFSRVTNHFGAPGGYASRSNEHGPAGHHTGVDFAGPVPGVSIAGVAVRSSTPGVVVISEYQRYDNGSSSMGNWIGVYFPRDDVTITYWHLALRAVKVGDRVERGQFIGRVGSTGNSTAPHLHVQANPGREFDYHAHVDPSRWVRGRAWAGTQYLLRKARARRK
jgi:murein DD-endopeptidase MepM/ murein hydrolase activator NlpD